MAAKTTIGFLATALMVGACSLPVMGQANGGGGTPPAAGQGGNGGGGGGQRGNWDPAQARQHMLDRIKGELGSSDDEFAALQPKIEKVLQDMRDAGGFGMGMRGGRNRGGQGGQAAPDANQPQSPVQLASKDLHDTLDNKDAKPEDIKAKLDALRAAKAKAKDDLAAAQKDLQSVLTQRQEAVLVEMGLLD